MRADHHRVDDRSVDGLADLWDDPLVTAMIQDNTKNPATQLTVDPWLPKNGAPPPADASSTTTSDAAGD